MAQQMVTDSMKAHADLLVGQALTWVRGRCKANGRAFVQFQSSRQGKDGEPAIYRADATHCTCPGFLHRGMCAHVIAVAMVGTKQRASKPMRSFSELYPKCRLCGDLVDGKAGSLCDDCCAAEVRRLDQERKRELVAGGR